MPKVVYSDSDSDNSNSDDNSDDNSEQVVGFHLNERKTYDTNELFYSVCYGSLYLTHVILSLFV